MNKSERDMWDEGMRPACGGSWHTPRYKVTLYRYAGGSEFWLCSDCARVAVAFGAVKVKTNKGA